MSDVKIQAINAIKWIDELPNYKQPPIGDRGYLGSDETGYCCLGVACKVLGLDYEPEEECSLELVQKIGLLNKLGAFKSIKYKEKYIALAAVNDESKEDNFTTIADFIKNNPEEVFNDQVAFILRKYYSGDEDIIKHTDK